MSKSIKLKNDTYIDSSSIVQDKNTLPNVLNNLIRLKEFKLVFDVSNASVGDHVIGSTKNNIPAVAGLAMVGFIVKTTSYANKNFVLMPQYRDGKVYAEILLGYKGTDKELTLYGYIVYVKTSLIENGTLE
ncbi:MAG: hypothetical protein ACI4VL_06765 [Bacilli bacterium]